MKESMNNKPKNEKDKIRNLQTNDNEKCWDKNNWGKNENEQEFHEIPVFHFSHLIEPNQYMM